MPKTAETANAATPSGKVANLLLILCYSALPAYLGYFSVSRADFTAEEIQRIFMLDIIHGFWPMVLWLLCFSATGALFAMLLVRTMVRDHWLSAMIVVYLHLVAVLILPVFIYGVLFFVVDLRLPNWFPVLKQSFSRANNIEFMVISELVFRHGMWLPLYGVPAAVVKLFFGGRRTPIEHKSDQDSPIRIL